MYTAQRFPPAIFTPPPALDVLTGASDAERVW